MSKGVEEEECETTIAGMGLTSLCELEYESSPESTTDVEERSAALRTLMQLVSSESSFMVPRHFFRLDRRFSLRGLTSETIKQNHDRVVQLLSSETPSGLAMERVDTGFVLSNFPQLCLYKSDELECMIRFLVSPLPPASYVSVTMVEDKGVGGSSVDCE